MLYREGLHWWEANGIPLCENRHVLVINIRYTGKYFIQVFMLPEYSYWIIGRQLPHEQENWQEVMEILDEYKADNR